MIGEIVIEFQDITKYPLLEFMERYRDFMTNDYESIRAYFNGETETIDNAHMSELSWLTNECHTLLTTFKNFANKFSCCAYWELMDFFDGLNNTIEKINKLPKFFRTSLSKRGYTASIQVRSTVGSGRTMEDLASAVTGSPQNDGSWVDIVQGNDMNESDWNIDSLTGVDVFVDNTRKIVVTTVLDQPIGNRIYGIDMNRKITFEGNDLQRVFYESNVEQKCEILLELNRGDVPEDNMFGKNPFFLGESIKNTSISIIVSQIQKTFLQNDLFQEVNLTDLKFEQGSLTMVFNIKTKYDYESTKAISI